MINFTFSSLSIDFELQYYFNKELKELFSKVVNIYLHDDILEVHFDGTEDASYESDVSDWINAYDSHDLDHEKRLFNEAIDARTNEIFDNLAVVGVPFNGNNFSMSLDAKINWLAISVKAILDKIVDGGLPPQSWPTFVSTVDDGEASLANSDEAIAFALSLLGSGSIPYDTGRALKQQVNAATTKSELDAIVDDR